MYSDSWFTHLDFIINMHKLWVQFDSHKSKIELFSWGWIKFYQNEYWTDLESINQIIYKVWNKDILNFKILWSYHWWKLESFLKKYKYPLINKYKTKEIIRNSDKLLENIEPWKVLRCSGYIIWNEFKNIIFLECWEMLKNSSIPRNSIIQELWENIWSQTNYNRAFSWEIHLAYELDEFLPIATVIIWFINYLNWNWFLSVSRFTLINQRITLTLSRISKLSKELFFQDWERKILYSKISEDWIIINGVLWNLNDDSIPASFFKLICNYFAINRTNTVRLSQLSIFIKEVWFKYLKEEQLTVDNVRKNYIPKINSEFIKTYTWELLDISWDLIEAKKLRNISHINPVDN